MTRLRNKSIMRGVCEFDAGPTVGELRAVTDGQLVLIYRRPHGSPAGTAYKHCLSDYAPARLTPRAVLDIYNHSLESAL